MTILTYPPLNYGHLKILFFVFSIMFISADCNESTSSSLSRTEAVITTAVVCVVCSFYCWTVNWYSTDSM